MPSEAFQKALFTPHSWTSEAKCSKHRWGLEKGEYGEGWVCPSHTQGEWCPEGRSEAATGKGLGSESHDERAGPASAGRTHGHVEGASSFTRQTRFLSLLLYSGHPGLGPCAHMQATMALGDPSTAGHREWDRDTCELSDQHPPPNAPFHGSKAFSR